MVPGSPRSGSMAELSEGPEQINGLPGSRSTTAVDNEENLVKSISGPLLRSH